MNRFKIKSKYNPPTIGNTLSYMNSWWNMTTPMKSMPFMTFSYMFYDNSSLVLKTM